VADPSWSDTFTARVGQAGGMDVVWFLLAIAVMVGLGWLGFQIEPHHVSKDGRRILCNAQLAHCPASVHTPPLARFKCRALLHPPRCLLQRLHNSLRVLQVQAQASRAAKLHY
jgi:hypothetical protein